MLQRTFSSLSAPPLTRKAPGLLLAKARAVTLPAWPLEAARHLPSRRSQARTCRDMRAATCEYRALACLLRSKKLLQCCDSLGVKTSCRCLPAGEPCDDKRSSSSMFHFPVSMGFASPPVPVHEKCAMLFLPADGRGKSLSRQLSSFLNIWLHAEQAALDQGGSPGRPCHQKPEAPARWPWELSNNPERARYRHGPSKFGCSSWCPGRTA